MGRINLYMLVTKTLLLSAIFFGLLNFCEAQTVKVMTYNIRYENPNDGDNSWANRRSLIVDQINSNQPDVIGTQEGLSSQIAFLSKSLTNYNYVGVGREDGKEKGEYAAIFYRKDKYKAVVDSTFWLSETPRVHSVGWDAVLERICTYALLEDIKTGKRIWVFNTHLDHKGEVARRESAKLILSEIERLNKKLYPVVLTGDFNAVETDEPITIIGSRLFDTFKIQKGKKRGSACATFNGFNMLETATERIDFIFVNQKDAKVKSHETLKLIVDNRYPSDHFPVMAVVKFK